MSIYLELIDKSEELLRKLRVTLRENNAGTINELAAKNPKAIPFLAEKIDHVVKVTTQLIFDRAIEIDKDKEKAKKILDRLVSLHGSLINAQAQLNLALKEAR